MEMGGSGREDGRGEVVDLFGEEGIALGGDELADASCRADRKRWRLSLGGGRR